MTRKSAERSEGHVVVLGGGIAGLTAAYVLRREPPAPAVTLVEADARLGGKVRTEPFRGRPFDVGADAFLARVPWATDLCREIGLGDDLVTPAHGAVKVWTRGRLRPLPDGLVLGAPTRLLPLLGAGILSPAGLARAALDLVLPRTDVAGDRSVAEVVRGRFGGEVLDRLVDPLIGGVYAGDTGRLSVEAAAPQLAAAARARRSLLLGLRDQAAAAAPSPRVTPVFHGLRGGLGQLVERLVERTDGLGLMAGETATAVTRAGDGYQVALASGRQLTADAVVVALPAFAAATVLADGWPGAATELAAIEHASVAVVALAYDRGALARPLDGSGFLVPRIEGRLVKACTWSSAKWAHLDQADDVVLRCSVGRAGDDTALALADDDLVARVHAELVEAMGLRRPPLEARVVRWEQALPQYAVGHVDRVRRIDAALARDPGLALAGAAYEGVGIAAVVHRADQVAHRVLVHLAG